MKIVSERRTRGDLIQMFKIMHKMDNIDIGNRFNIVKTKARGHCFKYFKEITRQSSRENYLFNRIANTWNSLPSELVQAPTVNRFKAGIDCCKHSMNRLF